jgi:hypothetical protein
MSTQSHTVKPLPEKFNALATYNAEIARGIVHTTAWEFRMAILQREYDEWLTGRND